MKTRGRLNRWMVATMIFMSGMFFCGCGGSDDKEKDETLPSGAFQLTVYNANTNIPLEDVLLNANAERTEENIILYSDRDGMIVGENIVAWDISGTLAKNGYDTVRFDFTIYPDTYTQTIFMQHIWQDAALTGQITDADTGVNIADARIVLLNTELSEQTISQFNNSVVYSAYNPAYFNTNESHSSSVTIEGADPEITWSNSSIIDTADADGDYSIAVPPYGTRYILVGKTGYYCKIVSAYMVNTTNKRVDLTLTSQ